MLEDDIRLAFRSVPYPGDGAIICMLTEEGYDVLRELQGQHWSDVSQSYLRDNATSIFFLTAQAYRFYLPAYLLASLDIDLANMIPYSVIATLVPGRRDEGEYRARVELLTGQQLAVVLDYLQWLRTAMGYLLKPAKIRKAIEKLVLEAERRRSREPERS